MYDNVTSGSRSLQTHYAPEGEILEQAQANVEAMQTYVDATRTGAKGWCSTNLSKGDMLSSLAPRFNTTAEAIAEANGIAWDTQAINRWVMATGGVWLPYVDGDRVVGSPTGGWAAFSSCSTILLPCTGKTDCKCKTPNAEDEGYPWYAFVVGALTSTAAWFAFQKKKRR